MSKLQLIIAREYKAKVKNKSFIIMTVLSPILIVGLITFVIFLVKSNSEEKKVIAIFNESPLFPKTLDNSGVILYKNLEGLTLEKAKDSVKSMGYYGLLHVPEYASIEETASQIQFYTEGAASMTVLGFIENQISRWLQGHKLASYGISNEIMEDLLEDYDLKNTDFLGNKNMRGINELRSILGAAFGYMIMMFIVIYGTLVMRSVIEEKTSRIVEVIISSVRPYQLMLGKIIGASLAGITQFIIWIGSSLLLGLIALQFIGGSSENYIPSTNTAMTEIVQNAGPSQEKLMILFSEFTKIPWAGLIAAFLVYFVLGYLIYSSIYAAIGSAVDNETDTQQFMWPVILPMVLAVYVGGFSVFENPHGPIAVGFSLFPLTSPVVMLMRIPSEIPVPWWQILLSLVLLFFTFLFMVWLASKIYRVGILSYGKKIGYKDLYKWLRYS